MRRATPAVAATIVAVAFVVGRAPVQADPTLAAIAPGAADDVMRSVAIGFGGEAYLGDGKGGWNREVGTGVSRTVTTASHSAALGVVIGADGAVFRLAPTPASWTAIRLAQKGRAILADGPRAVAALGRDIFELDRGAEPTRLGQASGAVTALGAGPRGVVFRTDRGVLRIDGHGAPHLVANVARDARLIGDRWAVSNASLVPGAHANAAVHVVDLASSARVDLPIGLAFAAATELTDGSLAIVATSAAGLELATITLGKLAHAPIPLPMATRPPIATGIVADGRGRLAITLRDGRIVVRDHATWTIASVHDDPPAPRPGAAPATMP